FGSTTVSTGVTVSNAGNLNIVTPTLNLADGSKLSVTGAASTINVTNSSIAGLAVMLTGSSTATISAAGGLITIDGAIGTNITIGGSGTGLNITGSPLLLVTGTGGAIAVNTALTSDHDITLQADGAIGGTATITT